MQAKITPPKRKTTSASRPKKPRAASATKATSPLKVRKLARALNISLADAQDMLQRANGEQASTNDSALNALAVEKPRNDKSS